MLTSILSHCSNYEDQPCSEGLRCFGNVLCSINWSSVVGPDNESPAQVEPVEEVPSNSVTGAQSPGSPSEPDSFVHSVPCNSMCLQPLSAFECIIGGDTIAYLPDCLAVAVGEMCQYKGGCAGEDHSYISNCSGGTPAFMRVFIEQCSGSMAAPPNSLFPTKSPQPSFNPSQPGGGYGLNDVQLANSTNTTDNPIADYDNYWGVPGQQEGDDSGDAMPGAWWTTWAADNRGSSRHTLPMFPLMSTIIAAMLILP